MCIVTAHQDDDSTPIDWDALARTGLTIVVLMGARRAGEIRDRLLAGGLGQDTAAAVITDATRPDQQVWRGPLRQLGSAPVPAPSVLVIGPVADAELSTVLAETGALRPPGPEVRLA